MSERRLKDNPQVVVEGWALDLYCRYNVDVVHDMDSWGVSIGGFSKSDARAEAKALGWVIHRDRTATCPKCAKALELR